MLETMLVLVAVVAAIIAIIVNRKSVLACVVITAVSAALCFGFLLLYANTHRLGSYPELVKFTLTASSILIVILVAVTYVGVKMHFSFKKKTPVEKKAVAAKTLPFEAAPAVKSAVAPSTTGNAARPTPVGIFGRQPITKTPKPVVAPRPVISVAPVVTPAPVAPIPPVVAPALADSLRRMLEKGDQFAAMQQYLLAEQMYITYIQRCEEPTPRIAAELKLLACCVEARDKEKAMQRLNGLVERMRSGEYVFDAEQKRALAESKMRLMAM